MIGAVDVAFDSGKYDYADLYTNGFIKVKKVLKRRILKRVVSNGHATQTTPPVLESYGSLCFSLKQKDL